MSRLKQSDSICMEGINEDSSSEFEFKINVNGEGHRDSSELVLTLLNTVDGESGVYDLSLLKI
jgi:hypothetical protein